MMEWNPNMDEAPYRTVLWVKNRHMEGPVLATRGFTCNGMVHEDSGFFTSVYTPDKHLPFPAGHLVIPDQWAYPEADNETG